jgi:hypothetical protein
MLKAKPMITNGKGRFTGQVDFVITVNLLAHLHRMEA